MAALIDEARRAAEGTPVDVPFVFRRIGTVVEPV
jgi:hypothetical protein